MWVNRKEVIPPLSAQQFRLLRALERRNGQVISRQQLIDDVWGSDEAEGVSEQAFDALVRRLRERLQSMDREHGYIVTVRGHGLRLDNPEIKMKTGRTDRSVRPVFDFQSSFSGSIPLKNAAPGGRHPAAA